MASLTSDSVVSKALLLCLVALISLPARRGAAADTDEKSRGRALLAEGLALMDNAHAQEALAKFEEAYRIVPSPKVLFNMGLAHRALGHTVDALECFEGFLGALPDAPEDARIYAERQVALLRADVSFVEISANLPGAEAWIDERPAGRLPLTKAVIVQPGAHVVTIRANGREVFRQEISTLPGKQDRVFAVEPPPSVRARAGHSWQRKAFWGAAAFSAVALAVGITEHISFDDKRGDYTDLLGRGGCIVGAPERGRCESLRSDASSAKTWAWIGYSAAVVGASGALLFWLLQPKSGPSRQTALVSIGCAPSAGIAGVSCVGRY